MSNDPSPSAPEAEDEHADEEHPPDERGSVTAVGGRRDTERDR